MPGYKGLAVTRQDWDMVFNICYSKYQRSPGQPEIAQISNYIPSFIKNHASSFNDCSFKPFPIFC